MNKFQWLCKRSRISDDIQLRWRLFIYSGSKQIISIFSKRHSLIEKYLKSQTPSKSILNEIIKCVSFINKSNCYVVVMAFFLAKASYSHKEIYDDMWLICEKLAADGEKRYKRSECFIRENLSTQEFILAALQLNLVTTRITHLNIEEADNYIQRIDLMYDVAVVEAPQTEEFTNTDDTESNIIRFEQEVIIILAFSVLMSR